VVPKRVGQTLEGKRGKTKCSEEENNGINLLSKLPPLTASLKIVLSLFLHLRNFFSCLFPSDIWLCHFRGHCPPLAAHTPVFIPPFSYICILVLSHGLFFYPENGSSRLSKT
jgi:hypothetical protein